MTVTVGEATPDDRLGVRRVLDAAMLEAREDLPDRIDAGDVLVAEAVRDDSEAVRGYSNAEEGDSETMRDDSKTETDRPILGALVLVPRGNAAHVSSGDTASAPGGDAARTPDEDAVHVDAVAVRRARRGQGIGAALVRTAAERHARLTAAFDSDVRPFYESLGFEISERKDGRLRGTLD
jgi:GNAT superfamily N-acetyltransferase